MKREKKFTTKLTEKEINDGVKLSKKMEKKYYATSKLRTALLVTAVAVLVGSSGYLGYRVITGGTGGGSSPTPSSDGYTVTFKDVNNENVLKTDKHMLYAIKPNEYTFTNTVDKYSSRIVHWFNDKELKNEFNFSTKLTSDISLYGQWESSHYTYTIHNEGADISEEHPLATGKIAHTNSTIQKSALTAPEITRKEFVNWYYDKECSEGKEVEFPLVVKEDVHLWPKYKQTHSLITFHCGEGSSIDSLTTPIDDTSREIPTPTLAGSKFSHWTIANENGIDVIDSQDKPIHLAQGDNPDKTSEGGENYLKCKLRTDAIDLNANYTQTAFKVAFYSTVDASGTPLKTFASAETISESDLKTFTAPTSPDDDKRFYGWINNNATEAEKKDKTKIIDFSKGPLTITEETKLVPVYAPYDYKVKVNMNGGSWKKDGETTVKCDDSYDIYVWDDIPMTSADILAQVKIAADRKDWTLIGDDVTPDYKAFSLTGASSYITDGILLNKTDTLEAIYNDAKHFTVTFDANGGYFAYYDSYGYLTTSEVISYTADLTAKSSYTVTELYNKAIESKTNCTLVRDGYLPNTFTEEEVTYSGWMVNNTLISTTFEFHEGTAFKADWKEETPTDFWNDGWTTVSNVSSRGITEFHDKYWKAYQSNTANGQSGGNLKWGNGDTTTKQTYDTSLTYGSFVGLEKDITLTGYGTFTTRIIGQEQDILSSSATSKALFTFDFVECPTVASIGKNNDYTNGFIPNNYAPLIRSSLPSGLRGNLKTVHKPILTAQDSSPYYKTDTYLNTDMFIPSAYEVNGGTTQPSQAAGKVCNSSGYAESLAFSGSDYLFTYDWYKYQYDLSYPSANNDISTPKDNARTISDLSDSASSTSGKHYRAKTFTCYDESQKKIVTKNSSWLLRTPAMSSLYSPYNSNQNLNCSLYVCDASEDTGAGKPYLGGIYSYFASDTRCLSMCFCI